MDDLIITANNPVAIISFKKHLDACFHMKDFITIEVDRNSNDIYIS